MRIRIDKNIRKMESQILKNYLKEQLHKAKVWAIGYIFFPIACLLMYFLHVILCVSYRLIYIEGNPYPRNDLGSLLVAISSIGQIKLQLGLLKKRPIFAMINFIMLVLFFIASYLTFTGLPLPEKTRFLQDFCIKGNFLPHTVKELMI